MSIGTILLIILVIALLGGFSGIGGGRFYGTGYYGGGGLGLVLVIVLVLVLLGTDLTISQKPFEGLPPHIEEAVQSIALLHNAHHKNASGLERLVDFASAQVSRPACLVLLASATAALGGGQSRAGKRSAMRPSIRRLSPGPMTFSPCWRWWWR